MKEYPKVAKIRSEGQLIAAEQKYRTYHNELIPFAKNTPYTEVARIIPDTDGDYVNPIYLFRSRHMTTIGSTELAKKAVRYMKIMANEMDTKIDVLSMSTGMEGNKIGLLGLVRIYSEDPPHFRKLSDYLGENTEYIEPSTRKKEPEDRKISPDTVTKKDILGHEKKIKEQIAILHSATEETPFLNSLSNYTRVKLEEDQEPEQYDLLTRDMQTATILDYREFIRIFRECMQYITSSERDSYENVIRGRTSRSEFTTNIISDYVDRTFIHTRRMPLEDKPALMAKLDRSLFALYIVQDLIDDPLITDIKITDPHTIRVRTYGKAQLSNVTFIDDEDYFRFIRMVAMKNNIDISIPVQTFTDERDESYILRFSLTAAYITSTHYPIIHIRKVARGKLMAPDLIKAGMFDEKIKDYLLDCGKTSRGVVFAGPPGSGKTVCLNWFLEDAYESSAEILVIQENDELFTYRKGVMFEHVVENPQKGERRCTLEDLGKMALVAGANVFVIGEAKGAEICSAITLSNSGCRTAITIHSPSSTETIDKMADLAMRGYVDSYTQAKRMMKSFQTIVYLKDFKVQEISEIIGFDEEKKDMIYRAIYRRDKDTRNDNDH